MRRPLVVRALPALVTTLALALAALLSVPRPAPGAWHAHAFTLPPGTMFATADACMACHNGLTTPAGEDVSIGTDWRASMMANSARDPYWQAAVRREILDHPGHASAIEDECSICHMPMSTYTARANGRSGRVFERLGRGPTPTAADPAALDGVSCTVCHQITSDRLGTPASFTGGFVIDTALADRRRIFGPFPVDSGRTRIMHSASGFVPTEGRHLQDSELCATCHTLYTDPLGEGDGGGARAAFPEQTPYLEWRHSSHRETASCQTCHMPVVDDSVSIASVWGTPRRQMSRHVFRGGNFFMLRMLNRYRAELGVAASPQELEAAAQRTLEHLQTRAARVDLDNLSRTGSRVTAEVAITNLAGHKLPTAYPSRRVWLRVTLRDGRGRVLFESGALEPDGRIVGNDNDRDGSTFEPHHEEISTPEQVAIYEAVMTDGRGRVTTGLLAAERYAKDNRLLPSGFDVRTAPADIAIRGSAVDDDDFAPGGDRVRYVIDVGEASGPFELEAGLFYQPIAFRWARNLADYDAFETRRFVRYYDSMAAASAALLARDTARIPE